MPELTITLQIKDELRLPISYQHMLQSVIYHALVLADEAYAGQLHEHGVRVGNNRYKLFVFSHLMGLKHLEGKTCVFRGNAVWEIRSPKAGFVALLKEAFLNVGRIRLGCVQLPIVKIEQRDVTLCTSCAHICMITPATAHYTIGKKTYYLSPDDERFYEQMQRNFERKWEAFFNIPAPHGVKFSPLSVSASDKCVTTFKNTFITGWFGQFELKATPEALIFLYQCGIGDRNSQGFGMFKLNERS